MPATHTRSAMNSVSTALAGGKTLATLMPRPVPDWTKKLDREDIPITKAIGRRPAPAVPANKREWGWGYPDPSTDTLGGALNASDVVLTVADSSKYAVRDTLSIDNEVVRVKAILSATTIEVFERGFGDSDAASHLSGAKVRFMAPAIAENADDPEGVMVQGALDYNYHQIMTTVFQFSQRAKVTPTFESGAGSGDRFQQELRKKMEFTMPLRLEYTICHGFRNEGDGNTNPSAMGGLKQPSYIGTRIDAGGALLTEYLLNQTIMDKWTAIADNMGKAIFAHPNVIRIFSSWYNGKRMLTGRDDSVKLTFSRFETIAGEFRFYPCYHMDTNRLYIMDPKDLALQPYHSSTGWQTGTIRAQDANGWYDKGFLRGDYTLIAEKPDSRIEIHNFDPDLTRYAGVA